MSDIATTEKANYSARAGQVIAGNLARGGDGKFAAAGAASKPRYTDPQKTKRAKLAAKRAAGKAKPKKAPRGKAAPKGADPTKTQARAAKIAEAKKKAADRAAEKLKKQVERTVAQGKKKAEADQKKAQAVAARNQRLAERKAQLLQRKADAEKKKAERQAKPAAGGKGGAAAKPKADASAKQQANRATVQTATLDKPAFDSLLALSEGDTPGDGADALVTNGLAERDVSGAYRLSFAGRAYLQAANSGDVGRAKDALSRARDRVAKRVTVKAQTAQDRAMFAKMGGGGSGGGGSSSGSAGLWKRGPDGKRVPSEAAVNRAKTQMQKASRTASDVQSEIMATHNKIAALQPSWGQKLQPKYQRERDQKIAELERTMTDLRTQLSSATTQQQAAYTRFQKLEQRAQSATKKEATPALTVLKQANGIHRWVAVSSTAFQDRDGQIVSTKALQDDCDRADLTGDYGTLNYWHTPLVLGDCDFNMVVGRSLIESGTFRSPQIAQAVASTTKAHKMSIGFRHPVTQPENGVFSYIKRFERSLVPAGRESNLFTSLLVKDTDMATEKEKMEAAAALLGPDILSRLLAQQQQTEKAADAAGVQFKETTEEVITEEVTEETTEETSEEMLLSDGEMDAIADRVVAKLAPLLQGVTAKEVAPPIDLSPLTQELATLKETNERELKALQEKQATTTKALQDRLNELEGSQPAAKPYRASQATDTVTTAKAAAPTNGIAPEFFAFAAGS